MPVWDAVAVHIRDPWAEAGPTVAEVRITRAHMVARLMAADLMVARRLPTAERRLMVVAQTDVQRPLTAAGLRVMAVDPMVGLHPLTAVEERHHTVEAEQLHLMEAVVT